MTQRYVLKRRERGWGTNPLEWRWCWGPWRTIASYASAKVARFNLRLRKFRCNGQFYSWGIFYGGKRL